MGEFLDAFNKGHEARQKRIDDEKRKAAAAQQQVQGNIDAARDWVDNVLAPVAVELHNDLKAVGTVEIADKSRPPFAGREITISLHGHKVTVLSFQVRPDRSINLYRDGSLAETIGSISSVNQVRIKQILRDTLQSIGEA